MLSKILVTFYSKNSDHAILSYSNSSNFSLIRDKISRWSSEYFYSKLKDEFDIFGEFVIIGKYSPQYIETFAYSSIAFSIFISQYMKSKSILTLNNFKLM